MELDEMKEAWNRYDQKLTESLRLNEELLRKLNLDKSKRELSSPLNYEIVSVVLNGVFILYIISATIQYSGEMKFLIPGILTTLFMLLLFAFNIHRLHLMLNIDYYNASVVELQKRIARLKQKYMQYRKIEFYIFPFFTVVAMPILVIALRHIDLYEHPWRFILAIVLTLSLGYPLIIWIYNNLYDKKLKNITTFLSDLKRFEKDE